MLYGIPNLPAPQYVYGSQRIGKVMAEYQRREWLRKDDSSSVFASIDEDGYPELLISDGQYSVDLMTLFGFDDPAQCQANLDAIRVLFDVLADFHSAYQNAIQDTVTR